MATARKKKPAHMIKGSAAAKRHMAAIRAKRKSNPARKKVAPKRKAIKRAAPKRKANPAKRKAVAKAPAKRGRPKLTAAQKLKKAASSVYKKRASTATKKSPSKRLVARRAVNTGPGMFPNPAPRGYNIVVIVDGKHVGFYDGSSAFDTEKKKAVIFQTSAQALKVAKSFADDAGRFYAVTPVKMTKAQILAQAGR